MAQKTALTPEEREQILDSFLEMWQQKRQDHMQEKQETEKLLLAEDWQRQNESILQRAGEQDGPTESVMWLKMRPENALDNDVSERETPPPPSEILQQLPADLPVQAMYAPIHVHINMPSNHNNESFRVIDQTQLVLQLQQRLQPYFVDMLSGIIKTELHKQTQAFVQRLQEHLNAEIPIMVEELLNENVPKILDELKK